MRPGHWTTAAPGRTQDIILDGPNLEVSSSGLAARVTFTPASGYGNRYFAIYLNAKKVASVYVAEGDSADVSVPFSAGTAGDVSVYAEDCGGWDSPYYNPNWGALELESDTSGIIRFRWAARWTLHERGDSGGQLANWSLSGLKRFSNIQPVDDWPTRGRLGVVLYDTAGTRTLELYNGNTKVASGTLVGDGALTLSEANDSGVTGSVDVVYSADITLAQGVIIEARWPASYQLHYSTSALTFPRTPEKTLNDGGNRNVFVSVSDILSAGTYNVAVLAVSDTGVADSATTATGTVVIKGPPAPPGQPAYSSGDISATVITWADSATAGVTYNVYDSDLDGVIDLDTPVATGATSPYTLPSKSGQEPGTRRVLVRAVLSGVEEKNIQWLKIEYDSLGARVSARPNTPTVHDVSVSSGRTISVEGVYDAAGEEGTATELQLFVWADGSSADYTTPSDTATLSAALGTIKTATMTYTPAADGWYYVGIRAATADGTQDTNTESILVYLSSADPADVDDFEAKAARG